MARKRAAIATCIYLPYDLLLCILWKLPVESLLRFLSVSRSWKNLITSPEFIKSKQGYHAIYSAYGNLFVVDVTKSPVITTKRIEFLQKIEEYGQFYQVLTACSRTGLILTMGRRRDRVGEPHQFLLWNPSTRQHQFVPYPPGIYDSWTSIGLFYDSIHDDYKIILIMYGILFFYTIYSFKKRRWSHRRRSSIYYLRMSYPGCKFYDQAISTERGLYWPLIPMKYMHLRGFSYKATKIIYFDTNSDELEELPAPEIVGLHQDKYRLTSLHGLLCLYGHLCDTSKVGIWTLEKDSNSEWTRYMTICNFPAPVVPRYCGDYFDFEPMCFTPNGEFIFLALKLLKLFIYNPKDNTFVTSKLSIEWAHWKSAVCVRSLYFPNYQYGRLKKHGVRRC